MCYPDKVIYLLRHGETVWNAAGRYQGRRDSPLTARGCEQAATLGRILAVATQNVDDVLIDNGMLPGDISEPCFQSGHTCVSQRRGLAIQHFTGVDVALTS
jgi:hypothetical protein